MFIVIEGPDGGGKGTLQRELQSRLFEDRRVDSIFLTREPTGSTYGKMALAGIDKGNIDIEALMHLFIQDRLIHSKLITNALECSQYVLCDRYYISTMVHQLYHLEKKDIATAKRARWLFDEHIQQICHPDIIIIVSPKYKTVKSRIISRAEKKGEEYSSIEKDIISGKNFGDDYIKACAELKHKYVKNLDICVYDGNNFDSIVKLVLRSL